MLRSYQPSRSRSSLTAFVSLFAILLALVSTTPAAAIAAWPLVKIGDNGPNVTTVQYLLRHRGYSLTVDGAFGSGTETQVKAFQSANSLTADGIVGANTWSKLVVSVDVGSSGDAVRGLQTQLRKHGYTSVTVDGVYGSGTSAAVQDFKTKHFLSGGTLVGATTWQELTGSSTGTSGGYSLPIPKTTLPRSEYDDPHHDYPAIDLPTATGTPAYAMKGGTVSYVGSGCGYGILITASDGATYKYCHLNSRSVASGATVSTGQLIGYTGNTGNSTGPHLHIEVNYGGLRCPQNMLLAIYDGASVPSPSSLPSSGCTY
ncbi:MAG TPA: peptidoglycan-binding protein [Roseiflexaceae bacterium]|nr:peptidoglycan-binding protein [Roseiflexaceae bacterium]